MHVIAYTSMHSVPRLASLWRSVVCLHRLADLADHYSQTLCTKFEHLAILRSGYWNLAAWDWTPGVRGGGVGEGGGGEKVYIYFIMQYTTSIPFTEEYIYHRVLKEYNKIYMRRRTEAIWFPGTEAIWVPETLQKIRKRKKTHRVYVVFYSSFYNTVFRFNNAGPGADFALANGRNQSPAITSQKQIQENIQ